MSAAGGGVGFQIVISLDMVCTFADAGLVLYLCLFMRIAMQECVLVMHGCGLICTAPSFVFRALLTSVSQEWVVLRQRTCACPLHGLSRSICSYVVGWS